MLSAETLWREVAHELDQAALHLYRAGRKLETLNHHNEATRIRNMCFDCRDMVKALSARQDHINTAPDQEKRAISNPSA